MFLLFFSGNPSLQKCRRAWETLPSTTSCIYPLSRILLYIVPSLCCLRRRRPPVILRLPELLRAAYSDRISSLKLHLHFLTSDDFSLSTRPLFLEIKGGNALLDLRDLLNGEPALSLRLIRAATLFQECV